MTVTTGFMRKIAINQYKNVNSTLKMPHNLILYLTPRCVFKMEQLIEKRYYSDHYVFGDGP